MSEEAVPNLGAVLVELSASIAPLREAALGYRQSLIDGGMSKEAADRCAADYHHWLMTMLPGQRQGMGGKVR